MAAYLIADIQVINRERYELYRSEMRHSLEKYGGKHLARGSQIDVLEGNWNPRRLVILEFPDIEAAKVFYNSPEYAKAKQLRENAALLNFVLIEGVDAGVM